MIARSLVVNMFRMACVCVPEYTGTYRYSFGQARQKVFFTSICHSRFSSICGSKFPIMHFAFFEKNIDDKL